jgi:hypothetical protein
MTTTNSTPRTRTDIDDERRSLERDYTAAERARNGRLCDAIAWALRLLDDEYEQATR